MFVDSEETGLSALFRKTENRAYSCVNKLG